MEKPKDKDFSLGDIMRLGEEMENLRHAISVVGGYATLSAGAMHPNKFKELQTKLADDLHSRLTASDQSRMEAMYYFFAGADYILNDVLNTSIALIAPPKPEVSGSKEPDND